mmetsp:Transcript_10252/g.27341  ORF Transcript_10252/g.27341 Transcript_10252/m.27341 type:complete len:214 (-) Transcript_10252:974-1615(-)
MHTRGAEAAGSYSVREKRAFQICASVFARSPATHGLRALLQKARVFALLGADERIALERISARVLARLLPDARNRARESITYCRWCWGNSAPNSLESVSHVFCGRLVQLHPAARRDRARPQVPVSFHICLPRIEGRKQQRESSHDSSVWPRAVQKFDQPPPKRKFALQMPLLPVRAATGRVSRNHTLKVLTHTTSGSRKLQVISSTRAESGQY